MSTVQEWSRRGAVDVKRARFSTPDPSKNTFNEPANTNELYYAMIDNVIVVLFYNISEAVGKYMETIQKYGD